MLNESGNESIPLTTQASYLAGHRYPIHNEPQNDEQLVDISYELHSMSALHNLQNQMPCQPAVDGRGLRQISGVPNHDDSHYSGYPKFTLPVKISGLVMLVGHETK